MKRAVQFEDECNKDSIAVTYDLAIAKVALRPKSDRLFVALGSFHIEILHLKFLLHSQDHNFQ